MAQIQYIMGGRKCLQPFTPGNYMIARRLARYQAVAVVQAGAVAFFVDPLPVI